MERESDGEERREEVEPERTDKDVEEHHGMKDVEKGEVGFPDGVNGEGTSINSTEYRTAMLQRLNPTNPLRIVINGGTRVAASAATRSMPTPSPPQSHVSVPRSTPTPQVTSFPDMFLYLILLYEKDEEKSVFSVSTKFIVFHFKNGFVFFFLCFGGFMAELRCDAQL